MVSFNGFFVEKNITSFFFSILLYIIKYIIINIS